ncbi:MAG: pirin family protein [Myxococcales bacterium]|nr:pirin family protein [Myxococcales bacterium]
MTDFVEKPDGVEAIVTARAMSLGGLAIARVIPSLERRTVGPFVFLDHLGPAGLAPGAGFDVPPHPHIGLATVTWLFDGEVVHRDSLGVTQAIRPGEVNLMIAGRGVTHSERSSDHFRQHGGAMHGLQFWMGLPTALEDCPPTFEHRGSGELPEVHLGAATARVVLGEAFGARSPATTPSETLLVELRFGDDDEVRIPAQKEAALYVAAGSATLGGTRYQAGTMIVLAPGTTVTITGADQSLVALFGGAPLDGGRRFMDWNFVASSKERLQQAREDWKAQRFPKIPGDDREFVPYPEPRR